MSILLIATNACFLMAYVMFFGTQTDQLVCKTFKLRECGHPIEYSLAILAFLLPILLLRSLGAIGYFSIVVLIFTFYAIGVIIYMCADIYTKSP